MKKIHYLLAMLTSLAALVLPGCTDDEITDPENNEATEQEGVAYFSLGVNILGYNANTSAATRSGDTESHNGDMTFEVESDESERQFNNLDVCVFRLEKTNSNNGTYAQLIETFQPIELLSSQTVDNVEFRQYVAELDFKPDFDTYNYYIMIFANNYMGNDVVSPKMNTRFYNWVKNPIRGSSEILMPEGYWLIKGYEGAGNLYMSNAHKTGNGYSNASVKDYETGATTKVKTFAKENTYSPLVQLTSDLVYNKLEDAESSDAAHLTIYLERSAAKFTVSQSENENALNYWANDNEIDIHEWNDEEGMQQMNPVLKVSDKQFWDDAPTISSIHHLYKGGKIKLIAHSYYNMNSRSFPFKHWYGGYWGNATNTTYGMNGLKPDDLSQLYANYTVFMAPGYHYDPYNEGTKTFYILNWSYTPRYYQRHFYDQKQNSKVPYKRSEYLSTIPEKGKVSCGTVNSVLSNGDTELLLINSGYCHFQKWENDAWYSLNEPCYVTENCTSYDGMYVSQATGMLLCGIWKPEGEEFEGVDDEGHPRSVIYCGEHLYSDESFVKKIYELCQKENLFNKGDDFDDKDQNGNVDMKAWEKTLSKITSDKQNADYEGGDGDNHSEYNLTLRKESYYLPLKETVGESERQSGALKLSNWLNDTINGGLLRYEYGKCYYVVYPRHFSDSDSNGITAWTSGDYTINQLGRYGVVRNHWYNLTVNSVRLPGKPYIPFDAVCNAYNDMQLDVYEHQNNIRCTFAPPEWSKSTTVVDEE